MLPEFRLFNFLGYFIKVNDVTTVTCINYISFMIYSNRVTGAFLFIQDSLSIILKIPSDQLTILTPWVQNISFFIKKETLNGLQMMTHKSLVVLIALLFNFTIEIPLVNFGVFTAWVKKISCLIEYQRGDISF